jgi:hypothetical protein
MSNMASVVLPSITRRLVIADPAWCDTPMLNRIFSEAVRSQQ